MIFSGAGAVAARVDGGAVIWNDNTADDAADTDDDDDADADAAHGAPDAADADAAAFALWLDVAAADEPAAYRARGRVRACGFWSALEIALTMERCVAALLESLFRGAGVARRKRECDLSDTACAPLGTTDRALAVVVVVVVVVIVSLAEGGPHVLRFLQLRAALRGRRGRECSGAGRLCAPPRQARRRARRGAGRVEFACARALAAASFRRRVCVGWRLGPGERFFPETKRCCATKTSLFFFLRERVRAASLSEFSKTTGSTSRRSLSTTQASRERGICIPTMYG